MTPIGALFLLLQATPAKPATPAPAGPDSAHLVIVATTDVHGRVLGWDDARDVEAPGGLSRVATILSTLRTQYPGQVIVVDAGDLIEGNPFATYFGRVAPARPNPIVDALNALNYDAATPGNHEFTFGVDALKTDIADATFQYVSANVLVPATQVERSDVPLFPPTTVVSRGGVRVGITGFTTPGVMVWERANVTGKIKVVPIAQAAPGALAALDRQGVDFKLVLVHAGLGDPSNYDTTGVGPENDAAVLAGLPSKPDLVVFGHTHREVRDTVIGGVHFVQPGPWARSVSVVHVWFRRVNGKWALDHLRADLIPLTGVSELPSFVRRETPAHDRVRSWASGTIGTGDAGFDGRYARAEDTPLLDFINEVQRRRAGADLSAASLEDPGVSLSGEVHERDLAAVYPYDNTLVAVRISGRQLKEYLERSTRYYRTYAPGQSVINAAVPGGSFDAVSGVDYQIDLTQPEGQRIRGLLYKGRPVTGVDSFTIALSSYRAAGGGGYDMLKGARVVYDRNEDIRGLLGAEIRRVGNLTPAAYFVRNWSILPPAAAAVRAVFAPAAGSVSDADSTMLRVLAITDLHGALAARTWDWSKGRPVGGVAALKTWFDSLAADCGCTTVRLDGGDEMQGTPISNFAFGRPVIAAFNRLGIDAAAIGNHEFDWSIDTLRARMAEANYPFLSANITDASGARPAWLDPWTIISRGGLKVVVLGLTTTSTPTTTEPRNVAGLTFGPLAAAVKRELPAARAAGNFVIVLAHEGAFCDSGACHGDIVDLARALDSGSVDLIVAGHTHVRINTRVNGIPIVEAASSGRDIAVVDFIRSGGRCCNVRTQVIDDYADQVRPDTGLAVLVARAQAKVDTVTRQPVATLRFALARQGDEYPLGHLIADAQLNMGRGDVSIMNNGGIRADLPAGAVTYGDLFQCQPFGNKLVRLTVPGTTLLDALEWSLGGGEARAQVGGVEVWYDARRPAGRRITRTKLTNGRKIDPKASYTLVVSDFLAAGGSGYAMLKGLPSASVGLTDLDALIAYLKVLPQPVDAPAEPRFHLN
ncbi:MAG TPA: 5'-nucleotidase C-terminal domain-containing protein [Gemmatimonadales bacterium]|nr:5'-nucleotidase C-terminal domain-containing protein [Gemmatimonadales bacterium]